MLIYVQPLPIYPTAVVMLCVAIASLFVTIIFDILDVNRRTRFYSRKCKDTLTAKERASILCILIGCISVLMCSLSIFVTFIVCKGADIFPYLFFNALIAVASIAYVSKLLKPYVMGKHQFLHVKVLEVCDCLNKDGYNALSLCTGFGQFFTVTSPKELYWRVGSYYEIEVKGSYVINIVNTPLSWESVRMYRQYTLRTNAFWHSPVYSGVLVFLAVAIAIVFYYTKLLPLVIVSCTLLLCSLMFYPWVLKRKLIPTHLVPTDKFIDLDDIGAYTFILKDKNGNNYYLQTDDTGIFEKSDVYVCECKGNIVNTVICPTDTHFRDSAHPKYTLMDLYIVSFILFTLASISYILSYSIPTIIFTSLFTMLIVGAFRYKKGGDGVYGSTYRL